MARQHYETLQEVFDDAYRGLAAQGFERSWKSGLGCAYRGDNGRRCAIGHCILDDVYNPNMEGLRPEHLLSGSLFADPSAKLTDLQKVHDYGRDPEMMKAGLRAFAQKNDLTIPSIEEAK